MSKIFAFSLIMLSSCVIYGMQEDKIAPESEVKACAANIEFLINVNNGSPFNRFLKLEENSQVGSLLSILLSRDNKAQLLVGDDTTSEAQEQVVYSMYRDKSTQQIIMNIWKVTPDDPLQDEDGKAVKNVLCPWNRPTEVKLEGVGMWAKQFDRNLEPATLAITITPRPIDEGVAKDVQIKDANLDKQVINTFLSTINDDDL